MGNDDDRPASSEASEPVGDKVRIFRRGRVWTANFQHAGRQHRVSLKTTSKKEARRRAFQLEVELLEGRWRVTPATATVAATIEAYTDFLRSEERAVNTLAKYTKVFERVAQLARDRKVKDVSGIDLRFIDAFRRMRMDDEIQEVTRNKETVIVRQLINFALSRDMVATDPLKGLKLKKPRPTAQPCWTYEQAQQILGASSEEIRPALLLLAETGMRFGEMAWLTWEDVDQNSNVLRIAPKEGWRPKTGDQRAVPLNAILKQLLASLPKCWRWVVTMPPSARHPRPGRQWTEKSLLAALKAVLKQLRLPGKLHTFRHTFISNALQKGTPVTLVREWVGHVDEAVLKTYTHVHNDASQAAMQRLAEANNSLQMKEISRNEAEHSTAQKQRSDEDDRAAHDAN